MFSLRDLCFLLCSRDLNVLRAQRIMGILNLITHKSTKSENPVTWSCGHVVIWVDLVNKCSQMIMAEYAFADGWA